MQCTATGQLLPAGNCRSQVSSCVSRRGLRQPPQDKIAKCPDALKQVTPPAPRPLTTTSRYDQEVTCPDVSGGKAGVVEQRVA
jgi:hypothetical protein